MNIHNLQIKNIEYDITQFPEEAAEIIKLLPKQIYQKISFYLTDINTAIANAIRRIIIEELEVKCLDFEIKDLDTSENYIIPDELHDKINYIPILQTIEPEFGSMLKSSDLSRIEQSLEFNLNLSNNTPNLMIVRAGDLTCSNKHVNIHEVVPSSYILTSLRPGRYINLKKIKVISGQGYKHSRFSLTSTYEYAPIDYITATILNQKCNFVKKHVSVVDVMKLLEKHGNVMHDKKEKFDKFNLFTKKILIIPNKNYMHLLNNFQRKRFDTYDIIIQNPAGYALESADDETFIKTYQASNVKCQDYYLSFTTYGNIEPLNMMMMCFDNLKQRLLKIQQTFAEISAEPDSSTALSNDFMSMIQDELKTVILIRGEDYTISKLLVRAIYELDPNIGLINDPLEHPSNRTVMINIIHAEPIKIFNDAINVCIGYTDTLTKLFSKK